MGQNFKRLSISAFCGFFFASLSLNAYADGFLSLLPEVPLPEKIVEIDNSDVIFDAPTGRIIQIAASGLNSKENILSFYQATMPQLGWIAKSTTEYVRENEKLTLSISTENNITLVQFELSPINMNNN